MGGLYVAVLAAGLGTRMRSDLPKVLHVLGGKPMVQYVVEAAGGLAPERIVAVVGHGEELVRELLGPGLAYAHQAEQRGTGDALAAAVSALDAPDGDLLVVYGDMPLLTTATLRRLMEHGRETGARAVLMTAHMSSASRFGRIIRDQAGRFERIVEYKDADASQRAISEVNVGVYYFRLAALREALPRLTPDNAQGEYYLTDLFPLIRAAGGTVSALPADNADEFAGPNDRAELAAAEALLRRRINHDWMVKGVTMIDPETTYIELDVKIGRDTILLPGTILAGRTVVGEACRIGPYAEVRDSRLGRGVEVDRAVVIGRDLPDGERVGPFAILRDHEDVSGRS